MQQQYPYANTAQGLASLGRGEDTMLMHITPEEFQDFNRMAQAAGYEHIPINPYTGLPEYGFGKAFKKVAKAVSKVVSSVTKSPIATTLLSAVAAPALGISPLMMGLGVGGITALSTGDLGKGLSAGLSAYGGANLGSGIGALGKNLTSAQANAYSSGLATGGGWNPATQAMAINPAAVPATVGTYAPASLTEHLGNMASGVGEIFTSPTTAWEGLKQAYGTVVPGTEATPETVTGITRNAAGDIVQTVSAPAVEATAASVTPGTPWDVISGVGGPVANIGMSLMEPEVDQPLTQEEIDKAAGVDYIAGGRTLNFATDDSKLRLYDNLPDTGIGTSTIAQGPTASYYTPEELKDLYEMSKGISYAKEGGIMKLASGRYLKGNGDGMSDGIKATIEGTQEARLSDGEFVVPADVVSHLGNGSSDAGAAKLYTMMDRIRKARTGKESQAQQIQPQRFMPA